MVHTVVISDGVFALLARLIVELLRQNGIQGKIEVARGCPKNKYCNAASFIADDNQILCCLGYVLKHPNTNLSDNMVILAIKPYLEKRYSIAAAKLAALMIPFKWGLNEPRISGRSDW